MQARRYRYKLRVRSKAKEQKLLMFAGAYRLLYNLALIQREFLWGQRRERTSYAKQCAELPELKKEFPWLAEVHSQVLQQALRDLDRAYRNFLSGRASRPKLKKKSRHLSFRYVQGVKIDGNRIYFPKIGWFRMFLSREIPKDTEIGEVTGLKEPDGWYVSIVVKGDFRKPAEDTKLVGIDVGIRDFACLSDGTKIEHPRILEKWLRKLAWEQKKLARKKKYSRRWHRQAQRVARIMQKIARIRHDFLHKVSTAIAKSHGVVVEDLRVKNISKRAKGKGVSAKSVLNRLILDSGWGMFLRMLEYKCEQYGQVFLKVAPNHTSQTCSVCGFVHPENRKGKLFRCLACGHTEDADVNAAKVILQKGLAALSGPTAGPAGSNARGEGSGGGTGLCPVYEPPLVEAGIPRL